jgi:hypothetical protein
MTRNCGLCRLSRPFSKGAFSHLDPVRLNEFMPWISNEQQTHDWVASSLGLDCYPIAYREPPRRPGLFLPQTGLAIPDRHPVPTYGSPRR